MKTKLPTAAVCGPSSEWEEITKTADRLAEQGKIVLVPFGTFDDNNEKQMAARYELMKEQIRMADEVVALNTYPRHSGTDDTMGIVSDDTMDCVNFAHAIGVPTSWANERKPDPAVIAMIGSHKFIDKFHELEAQYAMIDVITLLPYRFTFMDVMKREPTEDEEMRLDQLHCTKMLVSTKVLVVNPGGYIGEDTLKEIRWAIDNHIEVDYLEAPGEKLIYDEDE